jgi:hypothetical protein
MLQFPALDKFPKLDSLFPRVGTPGAELAVRRLFGGAGEAIVVDPAKVAAACSDTVDMGLPRAIVGPDAVEEHLKKLYPSGTKLVVERIADGERSGGFCWHREAEGLVGIGLRGITYLELDGSGLISRVQEGYEPLFKLDTLLEALLQAANANKGDGEAKTPAATYERASPRTAEGIVRYLWEVAYPGGASPSEALSFFADEIVYEDFNYREPFVGIEAVGEYIGLLDVFTDFVFIPERISQGDQRVCLTWRCEVNGQDGPSGISFNEVNGQGKICFARDIPAPAWPRPVGRLAAVLQPQLRTFGPTGGGGGSSSSSSSSSRGGGGGGAATAAAVAAAPPSAAARDRGSAWAAAFTTVSERPARLSMAAAYVGFSTYVALFSPGSFDVSPDSFDNQLIMRAIDDPSSLNPIFFAIFNALGVIPAINAALLLPGSRNQAPLPAVPFIVSSFALGFGGIGPYLTLREPRPQPLARSELGFFSRYVSESRLFGAGLLAASLFLVYGLVTISDLTAATTGFSELFASSKLVHVSTIDFCILSLLTFEPIREDMARRGWWTGGDGAEGNNLGRLLAFSLLPVVGPAAYLVARPSLPEE